MTYSIGDISKKCMLFPYPRYAITIPKVFSLTYKGNPVSASLLTENWISCA